MKKSDEFIRDKEFEYKKLWGDWSRKEKMAAFEEYEEQLTLTSVGCSLRHSKEDMLKAYQAGCLESVDDRIIYSLKDLKELKTDAIKWYKRFTE